MPKIITIKSITPKDEMKKLREIAKTSGRASPEYKQQLQKMTQQVSAVLKK